MLQHPTIDYYKHINALDGTPVNKPHYVCHFSSRRDHISHFVYRVYGKKNLIKIKYIHNRV